MKTLVEEVAGRAIEEREIAVGPSVQRQETEAVLRTLGLRKCYRGRCVVDNVSLDVRPGEIVGLLGPNGAGKTTTFYMIVGLIAPDEGRIFLGDDDITELPMYLRARRGIGYLPQEPSIFRKLTVEENLLAILQTLKLSDVERRERLTRLLEDFGLMGVRHVKGYALSGGERRRTEIARSLVTEPRFMLLDEPLAGIDPLALVDIQQIIRQLKDRGIGVLITDHNVREMLAITDRAYILSEGRVFRCGTPADLLEDAEVRRVYLGETFRL